MALDPILHGGAKPRTLAEAMEQREARAALRHTVRNCDIVFALAAGKAANPKALALGALRAAGSALNAGDIPRAEDAAAEAMRHIDAMAEDGQ